MQDLQWFAVETCPRAEYAALAELQAMGIEAYLPQETRMRRTAKGRVDVQHPLMPGIIFVAPGLRSIFDVKTSRAVRGVVLAAGGEPRAIQPILVDGWRRNYVSYLCEREREREGAFDYRARIKPAAKAKRFQRGDLAELLGKLRPALFPDLHPEALAA